jgi:hypothetical protein
VVEGRGAVPRGPYWYQGGSAHCSCRVLDCGEGRRERCPCSSRERSVDFLTLHQRRLVRGCWTRLGTPPHVQLYRDDTRYSPLRRPFDVLHPAKLDHLLRAPHRVAACKDVPSRVSNPTVCHGRIRALQGQRTPWIACRDCEFRISSRELTIEDDEGLVDTIRTCQESVSYSPADYRGS